MFLQTTSAIIVGLLFIGAHKMNSKATPFVPNPIEKTEAALAATSSTPPTLEQVDDENDLGNPYSLASLKENYKEADDVILADVTDIKPEYLPLQGYDPYSITATVREVFKGKTKRGQNLNYRFVYEFEPARKDVLGRQVLYLKKGTRNGEPVYNQMEFVAGDIRPGLLEKLRKLKARH